MKTIKELAREVAEIQNASNLSGVLHGAAAAIVELRDALPGLSTGAYNRHPIMRAWSSKIADLSGNYMGNYPADELAMILAAPDSDEDVRRSTAAAIGYQPKTGAPCSCRPGQSRDNCPTCEGTGMVIDFAAIRARRT